MGALILGHAHQHRLPAGHVPILRPLHRTPDYHIFCCCMVVNHRVRLISRGRHMKPTTIARLFLVPIVLFAIGCGEPTEAIANSSCSLCPATLTSQSIACETTLDDCIVAGHGTCAVGTLTLKSDGINNDYQDTYTGESGTWRRWDTTVVLDPTSGQSTDLDLVEGGTVCK